MDKIKLENLDAGIYRTVLWLRGENFDTTDSGDGVSKFEEAEELGEDPPEDVLDYPTVAILVDSDKLVEESHRLLGLLVERGIPLEEISGDEDAPCIEGSYDPANEVGIIMLANVDDSMLFAEDDDSYEDIEDIEPEAGVA